MQFLIVGLLKGSQIVRLKQEAEKLGSEVSGCLTSDLVVKIDGQKVSLSVNGRDLSEFDLIYLAAGVESKKRLEWFAACEYINKKFGTKIVNQAVIDTRLNYIPVQDWSFIKLAQNGIAQPKTYSVFNGDSLNEIVNEFGFPLIVKNSDTHQGKGIKLIKSKSDLEKIAYSDNVLFRKFIPNNGDIRILTVDGEAIGAMKRIPKTGDFRSNISAGGRGDNLDLTNYSNIKEIAEKSARACGLDIAGVDVIIDKTTGKPYVLEVNVGPQFKGFEKYTGINAASEIIKYFIKRCS